MATVSQSADTAGSIAPGPAVAGPHGGVDTYLTLRLSEEMNRVLEMLMRRTSLSKADVLNMAVGLLRAAAEAADQGKRVGIADADTELETEFVGL